VLVRLDHVASFIVQRESSQLSIRVVERNDALEIARGDLHIQNLGDVRVTGQKRFTCSGKPRSDSKGKQGGWLGNAWGDHWLHCLLLVIARLFPSYATLV
jgi:hypothetical protein